MHTILILADVGDTGAAAVDAELRARRNGNSVRRVTGADLASAPYWFHSVSSSGSVTAIELSDRRLLRSDSIGAVLHRLRQIRPSGFDDAAPADREFAAGEMEALLVSWLRSLPCPVVNEPFTGTLRGAGRTEAEWLWLAGHAGLPVREIALPEAEPVTGIGEQPGSFLIAGRRITGRRPRGWDEPARRLARMAGCDLLELYFKEEECGPKACTVDPYPVLRQPAEVEAAADLLEVRAAERVPA